jgi:ribosomal protein L11 methyltransferase
MSQWMEIKIHTKYDAADAVGDIFYRNGANGLVIEDIEISLDKNSSIDWDYTELPINEKPPECVNIVAYLPIDDTIFKTIEEIQAEIENIKDYGLDVGTGDLEYHSVDEKDWQGNWKEFFTPIKIGKTFIVKPTWEELESDFENVITIEPGMAFGTGSHTTTQQALILLERYMTENMKIIDVGCGSGILTIAAGKLNADFVLAIDVDEQAIKMTKENLSLNEIKKTNIEVIENNLLEGIDLSVDLVVANITAPILNRLIPQAARITKNNGFFVCAGIIDEYEVEVQEKLIANGYKIIDRLVERDWVALAASKVR